jgi:Na+/H+ antiporter NhaD/arsenite permease-like protein
MNLPIADIMKNFQYNVLVILISMELFTNLIVETGIMQVIAVKLALRSNGNKKAVLVLFGSMMFVISSFLNNITAVMIILPVIFVLLKAVDLTQKYVRIFFGALLAICNTGGASSPIGDFPAIIIMTSGITTFFDYLRRAMPIFLFTTMAIICYWSLKISDKESRELQSLGVNLLRARHKHIKLDKKLLYALCVIFTIMFLTWSFAPQEIIPPEVVAVLGYAVAAAVSALLGKKIKLTIDFKAVLTIASFLFMAGVISATGILDRMAFILKDNISDPRLLLITIMLITSILSGLCSAGPAAAAMMPVIIDLCQTTLSSQSHWVAIAYAASICAGSSFFLWSATAGFILSAKIENADLGFVWGAGGYLKYGLVNYVIQMIIALYAIILLV